MIQLGTDIVGMPLTQAIVKSFKGRSSFLRTAIKRSNLLNFAFLANIRAK
jgi:hypothetical protein